MTDKLRGYIEAQFKDAPKTKETVELKEEMLQNLTDKYNDLLAEGKSEESAFNIATASMGDISELINDLKARQRSRNVSSEEISAARKSSAFLTTAAIILYIISVIPVIIIQSDWGVVAMFGIIASATGMLVYSNMTKPKYLKADDTIVEEFKEWQSNANNANKKAVYKSIVHAMWMIILVIYFVVSFTTGAWYITWVLFLIGSAVNGIIKAIFDLKG